MPGCAAQWAASPGLCLSPPIQRGYPAPLKSALDFLYHEWHDKPATTVTYGTRGGYRGADQLRRCASIRPPHAPARRPPGDRRSPTDLDETGSRRPRRDPPVASWSRQSESTPRPGRGADLTRRRVDAAVRAGAAGPCEACGERTGRAEARSCSCAAVISVGVPSARSSAVEHRIELAVDLRRPRLRRDDRRASSGRCR